MVLVALVLLAGTILLPIVALQTALHVDAARDAREREDGCAFEDPEEHTSSAAWCALALGELVATLRVAGTALLPARARAGDDGRRSVVLVAGWAMPAASMSTLARRLRRNGWSRVYVVRLGAFASLDDGAHRLAAALAALRSTHAVGDADLIAAGLSGLVVRTLLRHDARAARLRRIVTLGTPHQGTLAAAWLRVGPWAHDVRPDGGAYATADPDAIAIASAHDVVLVPSTLAYWPGVFNVALRGVGHVGMLCSSRVWALVEENLAHEQVDASPGRSHVG